jgi:hypothetical protein
MLQVIENLQFQMLIKLPTDESKSYPRAHLCIADPLNTSSRTLVLYFLLSSITSIRSVCSFEQDVSSRNDALSFSLALWTLRDRLSALSTTLGSIGHWRLVSLVKAFTNRLRILGSGFVLLSAFLPLGDRHVSAHNLLLCHQAQWPLDSVHIM